MKETTNQIISRDLLAKLRANGVKRIVFDEGDIREVEFFADVPTGTGVENASTETDFEAELRERTEGYETALAQVATRKFQKRGES